MKHPPISAHPGHGLLTMLMVLACLLATPRPSPAGEETAIPDPETVRNRIDRMIDWHKHLGRPASLGLLRDAVSFTIEYGAPTYNEGDHEATRAFYAQTARDLVDQFEAGKNENPSPAARQSLEVLAEALERTRNAPGAEEAAWSLRYAFDRILLAYQVRKAHLQALMALGDQYFKRAQFADAADAFARATGMLRDLRGENTETLARNLRLAPFACGHALMSAGQYAESARMLTEGLGYVPDWPEIELDRAAFYADPAAYNQIFQALQQAARDHPQDADIQFLLGYEYHFQGAREKALEQFDKALELAPRHEGARHFEQHDADRHAA